METEEDLNQLRQVNEALQEKAELLEQQNRLLEELVDTGQKTYNLQNQVIEKLQEQITLLEQKVDALELQLKENSFNSQFLPSPTRFSLPPKNLLKKSNKKRH